MIRSRTMLVLLAWSQTIIYGQHAHQGPGQTTENPVALLSRLGNYSHRISTSQPQAQQFFDQGLRLLYGFNRYEALRSFRQAAALDPQAVKPLWGIAMALGPHINMDMDGDVDLKQGCEALAKAQSLSAQASAYERAYLEAATSRCPAYEPERYSAAMHRLHEQYPDDLDAATLYAESLMIKPRWNWWNADGTPAEGMAEAVSLLEQVMRRNPDHPGANHFYIHAVEMSPSPERAIPSAQRLMGIVPAAGHLVHMPGHIWVILGEWETAAAVNERAAQVDREYFAATNTQSSYRGYYLHNLHFVTYARSMQGRLAEAIAAADLIAREALPAVDTMPEMADAFSPNYILMRVRGARWDDLLSLPRPHEKLRATSALWHWARALALHAKGQRDGASREVQLFRETAAKIPPAWPWMNSKAVDVLAMADEILKARLAPDARTALPHWQRAVNQQDRLNYDEPPPWYMPLREAWGAALLRSGDAAGAEAVFREGMRKTPRNGRLLFGLAQSLRAQQKTEAAAFVQAEWEREWKRAERPLQLEEL